MGIPAILIATAISLTMLVMFSDLPWTSRFRAKWIPVRVKKTRQIKHRAFSLLARPEPKNL
jgi:antibiotic biosynthesis monooxygenase (ABM) superfamily enzyme